MKSPNGKFKEMESVFKVNPYSMNLKYSNSSKC